MGCGEKRDSSDAAWVLVAPRPASGDLATFNAIVRMTSAWNEPSGADSVRRFRRAYLIVMNERVVN